MKNGQLRRNPSELLWNEHMHHSENVPFRLCVYAVPAAFSAARRRRDTVSKGGFAVLTTIQCLILYAAVCGLLTLICLLLFHAVPWPGYILTAVPAAALICFYQGFLKAFLVLAVINCITMIPYAFLTAADCPKLFLPAAAEIIFTAVQISHVPAEPAWHRILFGISLCCVFFAANAVYTICEVTHDLHHLH